MSSYLSYVIERKNEKGDFICIAKDELDENLIIVNQYILKDLFIESGLWTDMLNSKQDCSKETLYNFATKIKHSDSISDKCYPYNHRRLLHPITYKLSMNSFSKNELLEKTWNDIDFKFSDVIMRIPENMCNKYIDQLIPYIKFKDNLSIEDFICIREDLVKNKNIGKYTDKIFLTNTNCLEISFDTPYNFYQITHQFPNELVDNSKIYYCEYTHTLDDDFEVDIPQWSIQRVYVSNKDNLLEMKRQLCQELNRLDRECKAQNLAKDYISKIIDNYKEDNSGLMNELKEFIKGNEVFDDYDYIRCLHLQLEELKLLIQLVGNNGRFIWRID